MMENLTEKMVKIERDNLENKPQQQSVHMGKKYPCQECNFQAKWKSHLTTHLQSDHMGKKYPCKECDFQATQKSNIRKSNEHSNI